MARGNIVNSQYWQSGKQYTEYLMNQVCSGLTNNISPTDVDQLIERRGHFLMFELKTAPFELTDISTGQKKMFMAWFDKLRKYATLFIVEHEPLDRVDLNDHTRRMSVIRWDEVVGKATGTQMFPVRQGEIKWWVDNWFAHANGTPNDLVTTFRIKTGIYPPDALGTGKLGELTAANT